MEKEEKQKRTDIRIKPPAIDRGGCVATVSC